MKLAWVTDIHLNFIDERRAGSFCEALAGTGVGAILIGGDIAESHDLVFWLRFLEGRLRRPIYFVLGNHDYYGASVKEVRRRMEELSRSSEWLRWLPAEQPVRLTEEWALAGVDGWGDARYGDHDRSPIEPADFSEIRDLIGLDKASLGKRLRELGDGEAARVRESVPGALERFRNILFLTHVPPFIESCWYEGRTADDDWAPYFTCKAVGEALAELMRGRAERRMTVLCGHTHNSGEALILPNLLVRTGRARYGDPEIQVPLIEIT
jgi:Icc protein